MTEASIAKLRRHAEHFDSQNTEVEMIKPTTPAERRIVAATAAREARRTLYAATRTIDEAIRECTARFATGQDMARAAEDLERAIEPAIAAARVLWLHGKPEAQ